MDIIAQIKKVFFPTPSTGRQYPKIQTSFGEHAKSKALPEIILSACYLTVLSQKKAQFLYNPSVAQTRSAP